MGKRFLNTVLAIVAFVACYQYLGEDFVSSLTISLLSFIGYMLYDMHGYLEKISKKVS